MRICCRELAAMLPMSQAVDKAGQVPRVRLGAIQFQSEPKDICPLTHDALVFSTFVSSFVRVSGGTNASKAVELCLQNLAAPSSAGAGRAGCVVLMTDGDVGDCEKFQSEMLEKKINFFIVAYVSDRNAKCVLELQKLTLKAQNLMFLADFSEVRAVFSRIAVQSHAPPQLQARSRGISRALLTVLPPPEVIESGERDWLQISFRTPGKNEWKPMAVSQIRDCSIEGLQPDTLYTFRACLRLPGNTTTDWSAPLELRTMKAHPQHEVMTTQGLLEKTVDDMLGYLRNYVVPAEFRTLGVQHLRMLLFGKIGSGKSSYFNTLYTATRNRWSDRQVTADAPRSVTPSIMPINLNDSGTIVLCDSFGWDGQADSWGCAVPGGLLDQVIEGHVKPNVTEGAEIKRHIEHPTAAELMHSVIVVYPITAIGDSGARNMLKKFFQRLYAMGVQPIVILTKADLTKTSGDGGGQTDYVDAAHIYDSGVVETARGFFAKEISVPEEYIVPMVNYLGPPPMGASGEPVFDLARHQLAAYIMKLAVGQAEIRLAKALETQISVVLEEPGGKQRLVARIPETTDKLPDVRAFIHKLDQEDPEEMERWLFIRKNGKAVSRKEEGILPAEMCVGARTFPENSQYRAIFMVHSDSLSQPPGSPAPAPVPNPAPPGPAQAQTQEGLPPLAGPAEPVELLCYVDDEMAGSVSNWKAADSLGLLRKMLVAEGVLDLSVSTYFLRNGKAISLKDEADPSLRSGELMEGEAEELWAVRLTTNAPVTPRLEAVVSLDGNVVGYLELKETHQIQDIRGLLEKYGLEVPPTGNKIMRNIKGLKVPVADHAAKKLQGRDFIFTESDGTLYIYFQSSK